MESRAFERWSMAGLFICVGALCVSIPLGMSGDGNQAAYILGWATTIASFTLPVVGYIMALRGMRIQESSNLAMLSFIAPSVILLLLGVSAMPYAGDIMFLVFYGSIYLMMTGVLAFILTFEDGLDDGPALRQLKALCAVGIVGGVLMLLLSVVRYSGPFTGMCYGMGAIGGLGLTIKHSVSLTVGQRRRAIRAQLESDGLLPVEHN